ncbi:hypothetical protein [Nisaea sp.]|nr:hypothetical protein [Nisaea sp.]
MIRSIYAGRRAALATMHGKERAGRAMDHEAEDAFERLLSAGYL